MTPTTWRWRPSRPPAPPTPAAIKSALWDVTYTGVTGDIAFDDVNGDAIRDTAYIKHSTNDRRLGAGNRPDG